MILSAAVLLPIVVLAAIWVVFKLDTWGNP